MEHICCAIALANHTARTTGNNAEQITLPNI